MMVAKRKILVAVATLALALHGTAGWAQQAGGEGGVGAGRGGESGGASGGGAPAGGGQPGAHAQPEGAGQMRPAPGQPNAMQPRPGQPAGQPGVPNRAGEGQPGARPTAGEAQPGRGTGQRQGGDRQHPPRIGGENQGRFRQAIHGLGIGEAAAIGFALTVGAEVPRSVELHPLPPSIIEAYPDYEGYEFFVAHGDIVVVDPDSFEIVDEFPY
jgi:hypothetical protein